MEAPCKPLGNAKRHHGSPMEVSWVSSGNTAVPQWCNSVEVPRKSLGSAMEVIMEVLREFPTEALWKSHGRLHIGTVVQGFPTEIPLEAPWGINVSRKHQEHLRMRKYNGLPVEFHESPMEVLTKTLARHRSLLGAAWNSQETTRNSHGNPHVSLHVSIVFPWEHREIPTEIPLGVSCCHESSMGFPWKPCVSKKKAPWKFHASAARVPT